MHAYNVAGLVLGACVLLACGGPSDRAARPGMERPRIGLLMDTLELQERWQRDRDLFMARATQLGYETLVRSAEGDAALQAQQAAELLERGIQVLVIVPHDDEAAASIVEEAKAREVPVISYDRLVRNSDVDLYVSFDNVRVGEMQAQHLLARAPKGNYVLIGGSPADYNATLLREGQMKVLQPAVDARQIRIASSEWTEDWSPARARELTAAALERARNDVAAVVASNDGTAGGAIEALEKAGLAGKVAVSGQDADLAALRRIVDGTQTMTVYKPLRTLALLAANNAIRLAEGERIDTIRTVNNGYRDVPAMLIEPVPVDRNNLEATVLADGYHSRDEVFGNAR